MKPVFAPFQVGQIKEYKLIQIILILHKRF